MIETSDMQFEERMVTPREVEEDREAEVTLRPQTLVEYIGQDKVKENLAVYIEGSQAAWRPFGSRAAVRASGTGKDDLVLDHCPRNGRESSCDNWSGN